MEYSDRPVMCFACQEGPIIEGYGTLCVSIFRAIYPKVNGPPGPGEGKTSTMFGPQILIVLRLFTKSWSRLLWVVKIVGSDRNHDGRTHRIHLLGWAGNAEDTKLSNQMISKCSPQAMSNFSYGDSLGLRSMTILKPRCAWQAEQQSGLVRSEEQRMAESCISVSFRAKIGSDWLVNYSYTM